LEGGALADYEIPDDLRYTPEDEWARREQDRVVVGITDYAQQQLGDIVFVELPEVGACFAKGDAFGVIESVKAVSDLLAPLGGKVVAVNQGLDDRPEIVNADCYGAGWILAIAGDDEEELDSLLDARAYRARVDERSQE
jgi:glycine cleavage system H protein